MGLKPLLKQINPDVEPKYLGTNHYGSTCPGCNREFMMEAFFTESGEAVIVCTDCPIEDDDKRARAWGYNNAAHLDMQLRSLQKAPKFKPEPPKDEEKQPKVSVAEMVRWAQEHYRLVRSHDGLTFAVPREGAQIAKELPALRQGMRRQFSEHKEAKTGKMYVASDEMLKSVMGMLAAYAEDAEAEEVSIRAAQIREDKIYLDLGGSEAQVVEIVAGSWSIKNMGDGTPLFRRNSNVAKLETPVKGGNLDELRDLLGLHEDDPKWFLIRGWLVMSLFTMIPRPIFWATGEQGSAKSSRARMVLNVIDPVSALGSRPGKNERDDSVTAQGKFMVSWDNLTNVSQELSDWICRLVTGMTDPRREMYSDDGLRAPKIQRSGVATSLTLPNGLGNDAIERLMWIPFERMPNIDREPELELWAKYDEARPRILGGLLDLIADTLKHYEAARKIRRDDMPRMMDAAQVLLALDMAMGLDVGHYAAFRDRVDSTMQERALDDPFTSTVIQLVDNNNGTWKGTFGKLHEDLYFMVPDEYKIHWPKGARGVSAKLMQAKTSLRKVGIEVTDLGKSNKGALVQIHQNKK